MAKIRVCLDAGHHGLYNRSPVIPAYYESVAMWALHLMLKEELEDYGIEVTVTRAALNDDPSLWDRGQASRGHTLFVSLHSNACGTESVDRPVVLAYSEDDATAVDETSRDLGYKLAKVIEVTMGTSQPGNIALKKADWDRDGNGRLDDEWYGVLQASKKAGVPGVLLEHSFHTNTAATLWLSDDTNLRTLAQAEAAAIADYYGLKKEDSDMPVYEKLADVPKSYQPAIRKLMEKKALLGYSDPDPATLEDNILNLDETYCRVMTTLDKLGKLD